MRREDLRTAAAAAAGAAAALVAPALLRGEGLFPVGGLWRFPPWTSVLTPGSSNGLLSDQLLYFWPWRLFLKNELAGGHFPFWNPLILGGTPFLACVQAAPLFPTSLLLPVLSPAAWSIASAFLKLFAAGFFMVLHVRRLGATRAGAALSGTSFALCGFMVAWLGHPQSNAACLLPALFWALSRAFELDAPRAWVPVAVVAAGVLLGGHPPTALHVLAAGAAYALFLAARAPRPRRRALLLRAASSAAAGALLAAPALLPYLEYLSWSSTSASSQALSRWATRLSPWAILHLAMPLASGSPAHGAEVLGAAFGLTFESNFIERAGWVGLPALAFAGLAVVRRGGRPQTLFHAALALLGLAAALGAPPLPWVWRLAPGFSQANPTRLILLFCFGACVLGGLGCDEKSEPASARFFAAFAVFGLAVDAVAVGRIWGGLTAPERGFAAGQSAAFALEAVMAGLLLARPRWRRWAALPAALFLLRVGLGLNPSAPESLLYPETPGLRSLAAAQGEGRVLGLGWTLAPDLGMPLGLRDARGRDFTTLARYEELVTGRAGDFGFYGKSDALPQTARLLAISALAATPASAAGAPRDWTPAGGGDILVFRSPRPARRALFVSEARADDPERVLAEVRAPGFDPGRVLWLDDGLGAPSASGARGTARIARDEADAVDVEVESDGPGWLLLLDNWYPGWRVEVNGAPARLRRGDYAFRAVEVPKGRSFVRFSFVPRTFWIGIALAGLAASGLAWAWRRRAGI